MKGGFLNDITRHDYHNNQFQIYTYWVYRNAYRIFSQQHSLMNVARQWFCLS
jgi:hypothetical protein